MAKLSAYGRKEVWRVWNEEVRTAESGDVTTAKTWVALMSDGTVLRKLDIVVKRKNPDGSTQWDKWPGGWKVLSKKAAPDLKEKLSRMGYVG